MGKMHIKNTMMLLEASLNLYLERKLLNDEIALSGIEKCAKGLLQYVEQQRKRTENDEIDRGQYIEEKV